MTIGIDLGLAAGGGAASMDLEELLATRLLVQGNSGSGKSHLLRRLMEQSAPWVQQAVIDPEGDFISLAPRFGHVVIDAAEHSEATLQRAAERVRRHRVSVVLDLEGLEVERQLRHAAAFLGGLFEVERDAWNPMLVVVDEAQLFAPAAGGEAPDEARRAALGAMTNLMCRGRKRGLAGIIATQRLAKLAKNVAAEASNFLMGRTFLDIDMQRAAELLGMERRQAEQFRDLDRGHFVALGPAISRRPLPLRIGAVETESRGAGPALAPLPAPAPEEARALILDGVAEEAARAPLQRRAPPPPPRDILADLAAARPAAIVATPEPTAEEQAARRARMAEILADILRAEDAAFRAPGVLYQDFLVRLRIHEVAGTPPALPEFRRLLALARAGIGAEAETDAGWQEAATRAAMLPEDMQGVFLLLARAARDGAPCPEDAAIARAYGSASAARARRVLGFIEAQGLIVSRETGRGQRIVTLAGLAWETAPGAA